MKHYIFGFDAAAPERCADELASKGIDAVVLGGADARTARALSERGIGLYLCFGAHGLSAGLDGQERWSVDALGTPRRWFNSGCPRDEDILSAHLNAALDAVNGDVRGVFVDGARFASFASAEGEDAFFTCFCPRCMERPGSEAAREAVAQLQKTRVPAFMPLLREWLRSREERVQTYLDRFAERVHALRSDLEACAFVFSPSLAGFVGQTSAACRGLDIVAPMIYRRYPHAEGPACLNHEWAAVLRMFGDEVRRFAALADVEFPAPGRSVESILSDGFTPGFVGQEVARARAGMRPEQRLLPILQIEDDERARVASEAISGGADGVGWFMYGQAEL